MLSIKVRSILCIFSLAMITFLTSRYFPIEADVVNSPIVWRTLSESGLDFYKDWKPTVDNWYFTVYPVNFLFFSILGDDGRVPLVLSTAIFSFIIAVIVTKTYAKKDDILSYSLSILALTFLSAYSFVYGFVAHPFSHNSTNAYGFIALFIFIANIEKRSFIFSLILSTIMLFASIADPWFLASFFLPVLLVSIVNFRNDKFYILSNSIYILTFILSYSNEIQIALQIPTHNFTLVTTGEMINNFQWLILLVGQSLNIFLISNKFTHIASFCTWVVFIIFCTTVFFRSPIARNKYLIAILSITGVCSAFVLSYKSPGDMSLRFFMNVTIFTLAVTVLAMTTKLRIVSTLLLTLFIITSLYSYSVKTNPLRDQTAETKEYIKFLHENKLSYGYGSFWRLSANVNWLAKDDIHITPVFFDKNGDINFNAVRVQTMKSWHSKKFLEAAPARQFIAISLGGDTERCKDKELCMSTISERFGPPSEVLHFKELTLLVYNKKLFI